ncbi:hypothetical protein M378DRAFT_197516 [Amanita muscaria Koide BX008]|uniref:Uncharacterized protein n=1 Tax=Amanita muscaria (strain Koide BX008) TaxID=946122 RepID=A0A0C2ST01_AMAMK|nr:hypothetical protein M378DRAFT_197516 [Amanita muscaria Koide BX008]
MDDTSRGLDIVYKKLSALGKKAHEKYGCNIFAVIVTDKQAGNRPSRRGTIYESPGADGFFESRVKGAEDLLIKELLGFVPFHQSHSNSKATSSKGQSEISDDNPSESKNMVALESSLTKKTYARLVKRPLIDNAAKFGLQLNEHAFPWKSLPEHCAKAGLYIDNYPHGVLSPFGDQGRSVILSIADLPKSEKQAIVDSLTTKTVHPMSFAKAQNPDDIKESRLPVLIYEPPPPGSAQKRSKRFFLDGSFDFEGYLQASVSLIQAEKSKQRVDDDNDNDELNQGKNKKSDKKSRLDDKADHRPIASHDDERERESIVRRLKGDRSKNSLAHPMPTSRKRKVDWSTPELFTPESVEEKKRLEKRKRLNEGFIEKVPR